MSEAHIRWISGPLLRAATNDAFGLYEAVRVGPEALLGEVIRIDSDEITVQVYEDTTGLGIGETLNGTGLPLSVQLGPGLLGGTFDGLLRPLAGRETPFVQRGMNTARDERFRFEPQAVSGTRLEAGMPYAEVHSHRVRHQWLLVPPGVAGTITWIAPAGEYAESDTVLRLEDDQGRDRALTMVHDWPVRGPRPIHKRLPVNQPLITGQRIIDSLFPVGLGGRAAVPGGFGTGKTVLLETLAKWCSADIIIYIGCGERGNELTGMLEEFPELEDPRTGQPLMQRTVIIANTSNMPVAAREASIYTGVTLGEYYRDQGLDVALMADSTSRWAEALREISGRLGELPGEGGYPAYLSSRLADFYERAARVETLSNQRGSVTLMGTVSPPSGDFSEPVVTHTKRYVRSFWALDTRRAQARIYPAINPLNSYTEDVDQLAEWWRQQGNTEWSDLRRKMLDLLEQHVKLERMARIIGKDALAHPQQMTLASAELVTESFLRQSAFSPIDRYASPERQTAMLRALGRFIDLSRDAVQNGIDPNRVVSLPIYRRLQRMGEEISEDEMHGFERLENDMVEAFHQLRAEREDRETDAGASS